jgi:carbon starvation protein
MTLLPVGLGAIAVLLAGYLLYARFLARFFSLDPDRATPAHTRADGVDFVAARGPLLLAQHFSAISAAGPIAGPILAALWFGWGPGLAWILLGCVFIGAAHDFATLVASVRHRGLSVGEILRERLGRRAMVLYLSFVWIALVYVTIAFADLTAAAFVKPGSGGAVASSSVMYLLLALGLGFAFSRWRLGLLPATILTVLLLVAVIWFGREIPLALPAALTFGDPRLAWDGILLAYCFAASLLPMPVLMQPRGYLGGFLLYGFLASGVAGLLFGNIEIRQPAFVAWTSPGGATLLPFLFVTIACGACSGFHGLVCSGTTSRQLDRETDAPAVGYGAMLLEGLIAVISLATVMMLAPGDALLGKGFDVDQVFASGIARFTGVLGVPRDFGFAFGLLALTTFIYDTLDVCTRLGRYILEELLGFTGARGRVAATLLTLLPAAVFLALTGEKAYMKVWAAFGTSNQLLAALTLMGVAVWLRAEGRRSWFVAAPAVFLLGTTGWSLAATVADGGAAGLLRGISAILLLLAGALAFECGRAYFRPAPAAA